MLFFSAPSFAESGQEIFNKLCASCHAPNAGGVPNLGPNLTDNCFLHGGSEADILALIAKGSPTNPMMTAFSSQLSPDKLKSVAAYVHGLVGTNVAGGRACDKAPEKAAPAKAVPSKAAPVKANKPKVLAGNADKGQDLFQGLQRFEKDGPSCISCHSVKNDAVISGGLLGPDLTATLKGLSPAADQAVVGGFVQSKPVMQRAYGEKSLTKQEIADLAAFLARINKEQDRHMPGDTGLKLAASGIAGVFLLLGLYTMIWRRRKRGSVNQEIYDRQVKSS
jgi:mono/diheme cytochrome c family protein